mgnify:CR=1 FL=1
MGTNLSIPIYSLVAGDALAMIVFTVAGFARHDELVGAGLRLLSTFIPLCLAWGVTAPWLGLYDLGVISQPRQLLRILPAALIAAPLAGWLRGLALDAPIIPLFVLVMAAMVAALMLVWRTLWLFLAFRRMQHG